MRQLRWKNRYLTGEAEADRRNKTLVACLNGLMDATRQREHCQEVEDFLDRLAGEAESLLEQGGGEVAGTLRAGLLRVLPLSTRGTASCHDCGVCDMAEQKFAEHLQPSVSCLHLQGSAKP